MRWGGGGRTLVVHGDLVSTIASVVACEGGGAHDVHSAPRLLEEVGGGQEDHQS
jgi:hypothetical protein